MAWNKLLQAIMQQRQQGLSATPRVGMPEQGFQVEYTAPGYGNGSNGFTPTSPQDFMPEMAPRPPRKKRPDMSVEELIQELEERQRYADALLRAQQQSGVM